MTVEATAGFTLATSTSTQPVISFSSTTFSFTTSPAQRTQIVLTTGANTITPPVGASLFVLVPSTTSTVTKTLKGITGDTGYALAPALPWFLPLKSSPGAFVINASAGETVDAYWW